MAGINDAGYTHCTPIQAQVLPVVLEGKDVAGQAQTGTGKTAAFLIPIFMRLAASAPADPGLPRALIVAPTRELALQIKEEAAVLGRHTDIGISLAVGGMDYKAQADALRQGSDIIVGTPGRILDFMRQQIFKTSGIQAVVIDEADRLLDLGFAKDMRLILKKLPHYSRRQGMLFSATLSYRVMELTYEYMNLPEFIAVTPEDVTVEGIEQELFHVGQDQKLALLLGLFKRESWTRALVFANTRSGVEWLAQKLCGNGLAAEGITGDLPQKKRLKLMEQFKDGSLSILVATDVASRGIHVEDISHVINYDLPQDPENYIHRIGRTARAGKTGRALSLACENYVYYLEPIEKMLGAKIPVMAFDDSWCVPDQAGPVSRKKKALPRQSDRGKGKGQRGHSARPGREKAKHTAGAESKTPEEKKRRRPRRKKTAPNQAEQTPA